jgi:hypothetical protein
MANQTDKFDPDAYLASVAQVEPAGFDPDAYLAESAPAPQNLLAQSTAEEPWRPFFNSREEYEAAKQMQATTDTESVSAKAGMAARAGGAAALRVGLPAAAVALAPATGGASLAAIGAVSGVAGEYLGSKVAGEETSMGRMLSSGFLASIPGANLTRATVGAVAREGFKQGAGNTMATAIQTGIDEGRLPSAREAAMSFAGGAASAPLGKLAGGNGIAPRLTEEQTNMAKRDAVATAWRAAGGVIDPSLVDKPVFGLTDLAGTEGMKKAASSRNVLVTQRLIRKDLGISGSGPITVEALDAVRKDAGRAYQAAADISPSASSLVENIKQARFAAKEAGEVYKNTGNPAMRTEWHKLKDVAENLEDQLEAEAIAAGKANLVKDLRAARVLIAKAWDVESAVNVSNGQVDAEVLNAAYNGKNMTGGLQLVAEAAGNFPQNIREKSLIGSGASRIGTMFQGQGMAQGTPQGVIAGLYHKAGAPARRFLLSDVIQNWAATNPSSKMSESVRQALLRFSTLSASREAALDGNMFMPEAVDNRPYPARVD